MQKQRSVGFIILIAIIAIGLLFAFKEKPYPVDMVKAQFAPMKVFSEEEGKTKVAERYQITAPIDAFMQRITFNEGDSIKKEQLLLTLEPTPSSILDPRSRAQAEASLGAAEELEKIIQEMSEAAKSDKELAQITYDRSIELRKQKVIPQNEMDVVKAEKRRAEAVYRASQFAFVFTQYITQMSRSALDYEDMRQMGQDLRRFEVKSMTSGTILKLSGKSERIVKMGEVLMEIGDLSQLEIEADVLSSVAVQLKTNMPVEILRWGGATTLKGKIKRIEPSGFTKVSALGVDEQRVKVIISLDSDPSLYQGIKDGFRVETRFVLWQSDHVLQVPNSAIFHEQYASENSQKLWYVYVIEDNHLHKRAVKIGHRNNMMAEVVSGLEENEAVVSFLSNDMREGLKVVVKSK